MNFRKVFLSVYNLITLFCLSIVLCSCDVVEYNLTQDMWPDEDLNNFVIYAFGWGGYSFAVIDPLTGEIYRQMDNFKGIQSVISNEQGTSIFISTYNRSDPGSILKVNTATWQHEVIYEKAAYLLDDRNGGIFFITKQMGSSERIFGKINPVTGEVTEITNIDVIWGGLRDDDQIEIHPSKPLLYAVDGNKRFYRFDYTTTTTNYMFEGISLDPHFIISADGDFLYRTGRVLDLNREEIIRSYSVPFSAGKGSIAVRKDNKEAYITDPGQGPVIPANQSPSTRKRVYVYKMEENSITDTIDVGRLTDRISLTPQNRYAVVNDRQFSYFIIDLKERKVIKEQQYIENEAATLSVENFYMAAKPPSLK